MTKFCFLRDNTVNGSVPVMEKYEACFSSGGQFDNPYCPEEVELNCYILTPSGETKTVFGFWYEGFERCLRDRTEVLISTLEHDWRIRFTPQEWGEYRYYVELHDKKQGCRYRCPERDTLVFLAVPSERKGFLRVSKVDPAYLEYSDGSPYLGIGHNLCGWEWGGTDNREGTYEYDRWLYAMARNGANLAQFDFCEGDQIEWTPAYQELPFSQDWIGLNRYNQQNAWKMDRRFQTAEELGIFFRLTLFHWEDFDDETEQFPDWGWNRNPYWTANGGPAENVSIFFRDINCRRYVKYYLRYVTARWGYSANLLAYELWNEVDAPEVMWAKGDDCETQAMQILDWHQEMGAYLRELDSLHLVTTSYADSRRDPRMWKLACMDLTTVHRYTYFNEDYGQPKYDTEGTLACILQERFAQINKPVLFGEFALSPGGDIQKDFDPQGLEFHNQLWASLMLKSLGTAMHWTWGSYVEQNDLYRMYAPVAHFFADEDLRETTTFGNLGERDHPLLILGLMKLDRVYLWIKKRGWNFQAKANGISSEVKPGEHISVGGLTDGMYQIRFFNTMTGELLSEFERISKHGEMQVILPGFYGDLAVKIRPKPKTEDWVSKDFPQPQNSSLTETRTNHMRIHAGGVGFGGETEGYRFVYQKVKSDFILTARIVSLTNLGEHVSAGLMLRENLELIGKYLAVVMHPYNKAQILWHDENGTQELLAFEAGSYPVFGLQREGKRLCVCFARRDGAWEQIWEQMCSECETVYVGLTASSSHTITYVQADFDQIQFTKRKEEGAI